MTTLTWPNPKLMMSQHLEVLQGYANRAVLKQENLTLSETEDRVRRIRQLFGIGHSFGVTEKELVHLLFKNVFIARKGCECPVCRVRGDQAVVR